MKKRNWKKKNSVVVVKGKGKLNSLSLSVDNTVLDPNLIKLYIITFASHC